MISSRELINTEPQASHFIKKSLELLNSCSNEFLELVIADICTLADYVSTVCCDLKENELSRKVVSAFQRCSKLYDSGYKNVDGKVLTPFDVFIRQVVASDLVASELVASELGERSENPGIGCGIDFSDFDKLDYLEVQRYPVRKLPENDDTELDQDSKNSKKTTTRNKKRTNQHNETSTAKKQQNTNSRRSKKAASVVTEFPTDLFIRFCYYNSIILTVQKKYETAIFYLELVLSNKKVTIGFIQLEALKKYWLLKMLCPASAFSVPKIDGSVIIRSIMKMKNVFLSSRRRSAFQMPRPAIEIIDDEIIPSYLELKNEVSGVGNQNSGTVDLEHQNSENNQTSTPSQNSEAQQPRNMADLIQEEAYKTVINGGEF